MAQPHISEQLYMTQVTEAMLTSSSAVSKRPHDASCLSLSVFSFNSTKRRV